MADQAQPLIDQDGMAGLDVAAVKCPVDSTIAGKCLEAEPECESCRMGFGSSLDSMEMCPVAEEDVGLADFGGGC